LTDLKEKPKVRIENWYVGVYDILYGQVYGHTDSWLPDGAFVQTSRMVTFDREKGYAITQNTNYILGRPRRPFSEG
jgi:hypothetical protein